MISRMSIILAAGIAALGVSAIAVLQIGNDTQQNAQQERLAQPVERPNQNTPGTPGVPAPSAPPVSDESPYYWSHYKELAQAIAALPPWTKTGPRGEEWDGYLKLARVLQTLPPEDVERIFLIYMTHTPYPVDVNSGPHPYTQPLLLLRVMFELPTELFTDKERGRLRHYHVSTLANVLSFGPLQGQDKPPLSLSLPVGWAEDGPFLTAACKWRLLITGNLDNAFQPHLEYRYFREHYPVRKNLSRTDGGGVPHWGDIILEQRIGTEAFKRLKSGGE